MAKKTVPVLPNPDRLKYLTPVALFALSRLAGTDDVRYYLNGVVVAPTWAYALDGVSCGILEFQTPVDTGGDDYVFVPRHAIEKMHQALSISKYYANPKKCDIALLEPVSVAKDSLSWSNGGLSYSIDVEMDGMRERGKQLRAMSEIDYAAESPHRGFDAGRIAGIQRVIDLLSSTPASSKRPRPINFIVRGKAGVRITADYLPEFVGLLAPMCA